MLLFKSYIFSLNFVGPITAVETNLIYPPQMGEKQPDDIVKYYLESVLELMVNQVIIQNSFYLFIVCLVYLCIS